MAYIDFLSSVHKSTVRDYLARVNDPEYPKPKAAELARQWGFDYWDGDRRICYGGYRYMPGRWAPVARAMIEHYGIKPGDKILDIGCGKGFLLYEITLLVPGVEVYGIDISDYAIKNSKDEIRAYLRVGNATDLSFPDHAFDLVYSITTLHNLHNYDLDKALREMERVGKENKYLCVESYRNETEKANLLYWQVTCEAFCTPEEWEWWFRQTGYTGDHSFIYFE
ncbi:MAG TPA: methyltransferase domain-containing protein [Gammaproteobacteria bacterium]|nr:methyltransferase domain-containing protein [Gammaproteobacteria bacterium]